MHDTKLPSNKTFGYFFSSIFILSGIYLTFITETIYGYLLFCLAIILLIISKFKPILLNRLNYIWQQIGIKMGKIISPLIIGFIFFILITPIAIYMKIIKRDYLRLKNKNIDSYWFDKQSKRNQQESFKNQY